MADADLVATLKAIRSQLDNQAIVVHQTLQQHMTSVDSRLAELKSQFIEYGSPAMFTVEPHPCSPVPRALPPQRVSNPNLYYAHEYEPPPVSQPYFYNPMSSAPKLCGENCNTQSASKVFDESPSRKSMVKTQVPGPIICNVSTSLSSTTSGLQGLETTKINEEHLSKMMTIFSENKKQLNKLFEQCLTVLDDGDPDDDCDCEGSDPVPADARSTSELGNNNFSSNLQCDLKFDFQKMDESTTIALDMFDEIPKKRKLEVAMESELKDKIGKKNDTGLVSDDFGCLVSENSREYKIMKELDEPVQFKDGTVVLRFDSKMTELIGDDGEEFFKSYDEVHNILDAMELQENSLRGIYTYGFEKPSAIWKFDPSHDWGGVVQAASELLKLGELIDLVISRGSNKLASQRKVSTNSLVLYHADGICHVYVDRSANIEMAKQIVLDAKMDPAACNAMEPLLVHKDLIRNGARNEFIMEFQISAVDIYGVYYGVYGKIVLRTMLLGNRGCNSLSYIQISTLRTRCFLKAWGMIQPKIV